MIKNAIVENHNEEITKSFKDDMLKTKNIAKNFTNSILNGKSGKSFVFAINADWGMGKTYLARNWDKYLKKQGYKSCYLNAFKYDWTDEPFMVIMKAIEDAISDENKKRKIKEAGISFLKNFFKVATRPLVQTIPYAPELLDTFQKTYEKYQEEIFNEQYNFFQGYGDNLTKFRNAISEAIKKMNKPLVIFIDELDRCKPSFAVELLEKVKHIFDIPDVVFILMINKDELSNIIKGYYGGSLDGITYLKKFINLEADLNLNFSMDKSKADAYITKTSKFIKAKPYRLIFSSTMTLLNPSLNFSYRDINQILTTMGYFHKYKEYMAILILLAIKITDFELYQKLKKYDKEAFEKLSEMLMKFYSDEILKEPFSSFGKHERESFIHFAYFVRKIKDEKFNDALKKTLAENSKKIGSKIEPKDISTEKCKQEIDNIFKLVDLHVNQY